MKSFLEVMKFTFKENFKKKAYIVSTVILFILVVAFMLIPVVINKLSDNKKDTLPGESNKDNKTGILYVIDTPNIFNNDTSSLKSILPTYDVIFKIKEDSDSLRKIVADDTKNNNYLLVINEDENPGSIYAEYCYREYGKGPYPDTLKDAVKDAYNLSLLKTSSVPEDVIMNLRTPMTLIQSELGKGVVQNQIAGILIIMLLFFAIYYYGYWVATSVASEKTSRIIEMLVTSTKPKYIILGKTAAMGLLGLIQLSVIIITASAMYTFVFPEDFTIFGQRLSFSSFTPLTIIVIVVYFLLGYTLYATLNSVAGASVSKSEDVNSAIMPTSMISLAAFYLSYFPSVMNGSENTIRLLSIIPFSSPYSMPDRILKQDVPTGELFLSLALIICTIGLFAWISIRIYSSAILHYGKRLKLKDLINLAKK